jgi:radical SAM protein with 4Fe4S-binding SPASM domain
LGIPLGYEIAYQGEVEDLAGTPSTLSGLDPAGASPRNPCVGDNAGVQGAPETPSSPAEVDAAPRHRCTCNIPPELWHWPPTALCDEPWTKALISVDGDVTFCCYHIPDVVLGNVQETPFEDIWNGPRARTVRALLMGEDVPRCCRDCYLFYEG